MTAICDNLGSEVAAWLSIFDDHGFYEAVQGLEDNRSPKKFQGRMEETVFFIPHPTTSGQCICLVCLTVFNQFKVYTIKRHSEMADGAASKYERLLSTRA